MDKVTSTNVVDDFYLAINQKWLTENPIPDDYSAWGSFNVLSNETLIKLRDILDNDNLFNHDNWVDWSKVKLLWELGNDHIQLNQENIKDILEKHVNEILNINSTTELVNYMFDTNVCSCPFGLDVSSDMEDSKSNVIYLDASGLGLPDKDMYLLESMESKRNAYKNYLTKIASYIQTNMSFDSDNQIDTSSIYNLEYILASYRLSKTERRDPTNIYHQYTIEQLSKLVPTFNIELQFKKLNLDVNKIKYVIVTEPKYFEKLNELLNTNIQVWKEYLLIKLFKMAGTYTNDVLNQIIFDFYGKSLSGQQEQKPRWKRVLGTVDAYVGEILGRKYVSKYFSEDSKQLVLNMINQMKAKLAERINKLSWMSKETQIKALEKLNKITSKIGYPDKWENFDELVFISEHLTPSTKSDNNTTEQTNDIKDKLPKLRYFDCIVKCNQWATNKNLRKYDKPVDNTEWGMTPHTINAYYNPSLNEIVFPAGILQEPFFSPSSSLASNFGGIGAVICHEITHGFDDEGCKFDSEGNLNNWWTDDDKSLFDEASKKLEEQFNCYQVEGMNINGKLTLGENIADLGGVSITLDCLKEYLTTHPELDYDQELKNFFTQWAVIWRTNIRPDEAKQRVVTDPHSPGSLRVNGILKNIPEFYQIYNITDANQMYLEPEKRCTIW